MRSPRLIPFALILVIASSCQPRARHEAEPATVAADMPRELPGLHNLHRINNRLISGSSPEGEEGFQSLASLGVKTIISVDGAKPDLARARAHDMRYVHLPIGYDGVPRERSLQLARVVRDFPGPIYIHCHHGKHRGPAAALSVRLCLDESCSVAEAIAEMERMGTDPRYVGLFESQRQLRRPTAAELDALPGDFAEATVVSPLIQSMVAVDTHFDHLKLIRSHGWRTPSSHPDLVPAHEALLLAEQYRELVRSSSLDPAMKQVMSLAEQHARDLEQALRLKKDAATIQQSFSAVAGDCQQCHQAHRDRPRQR